MSPRDLLRQQTGLNLTQPVVDRAVAERMTACGLASVDHYLDLLASQAGELQALTELVVVPESWMFRDPEAFAAVVRFTRARLAAYPTRIVRILSIPCAGGEEPYSIAMALHDAGVPGSSIIIDAIDLSETALERARRGRYTRNAFRSGDLAFRERHFEPVGSEYQINQNIRDLVGFSQGNLIALDAASNSGRYDVIFCRNLLIYFDEATTATAVAKLALMLSDDGVLFAGYAEVPTFCTHGFTPMRTPGAFALQKERRHEARLSGQPREEAVPPALPARPQLVPAPVPAPAPALAPAPAPASAARKPAAPVAKAPPDTATALETANRLANLGDYTGAASLCHEVLRAQPDSADAYFILGMISECERKPGAADSYWRRCVYLQPEHYEALCHLALLAEKNGDPQQAAHLKQRAARVYNRRDDHAMRKPAP